jgi:hypothetical protein
MSVLVSLYRGLEMSLRILKQRRIVVVSMFLVVRLAEQGCVGAHRVMFDLVLGAWLVVEMVREERVMVL